MKTNLLFLSLALASSIASASDCTKHIKYHYESQGNRVISITLEETDGSAAIYNVRGNLHSGDFLDQVTANAKTCDIVEITNVWAE